MRRAASGRAKLGAIVRLPHRDDLSSPRFPAPRVTPELDILLKVLRGEAARWPAAADAGFDERFLAACGAEDVSALVEHRLHAKADAGGWPRVVREALRRTATTRAAVDMLLERELIVTLAALADAGIGALLLKGGALAYTHYAEPHLRARCDTDVAPWYVVPADRKWYRNWAITQLLIEALEDMALEWPEADFDVDAERRRLQAVP
jgi:hypothetical protein